MSSIDLTSMETAFPGVELLIYDRVHRFRRRYPHFDFEELKSMAFEAFVDAYLSYDSDKSKFTTWVAYHIWKKLASHLRLLARRHRNLKPIDGLDPDTIAMEPTCLCDFWDELSLDSQLVVELLFEDAGSVLYHTYRPSAYRTKIAIKRFLENLGWSRDRILESFKEIETVLTS